MPNPAEQYAQNTKKLIGLLESVNFSKSRLPRHILEDLQPGKRICKLEFAVRVILIGKLKHTRLRVYADIGPIDELLMNLADRLVRYVNTGEAISAQMAITALTRGIADIRCGLPQNPDISQEEYISANAKYLSQWLSLVKWSEVYDQQTKSLIAQRRIHNEKVDDLEASIDRVYNRIQEDPEFATSFFYILDHGGIADRSSWNDAHRELHQTLVQFKINRFTLAMSNRGLESLEQEQLSTQQKIDTLLVKLSKEPIVADAQLMKEYREYMEGYIKDLAASDALTEETMRLVDELEGALMQLDQSSSVARQKEAAAEAARNTIEQIQRKQQAEVLAQQNPSAHSNTHN